jgi:hypothetical protein
MVARFPREIDGRRAGGRSGSWRRHYVKSRCPVQRLTGYAGPGGIRGAGWFTIAPVGVKRKGCDLAAVAAGRAIAYL